MAPHHVALTRGVELDLAGVPRVVAIRDHNGHAGLDATEGDGISESVRNLLVDPERHVRHARELDGVQRFARSTARLLHAAVVPAATGFEDTEGDNAGW